MYDEVIKQLIMQNHSSMKTISIYACCLYVQNNC